MSNDGSKWVTALCEVFFTITSTTTQQKLAALKPKLSPYTPM
jgi:hypothetical protein